MGELNVTTSLEFESKILSYPDFVREKMKFLRELAIEVAKEIPVNELKKCINATLMYHNVKDDITLGL